MSGFNERIHAYGAWRGNIAGALEGFSRWLDAQALQDGSVRARLDALRERLANDRMVVAFVAEFSRGKSELINALFFSDYGQRILPSAAGRTTMCPTELMYDPEQPPGLRLLPIETRLRDISLTDLRDRPQEWISVPFDPASVRSVRSAFECVRETRRVSLEEAILMGLLGETQAASPLGLGDDGLVEVSRWRHAIANLPHPLLKTGLVVIDTPGLNALGAEPELTLNLIPSAHAVVFILAADAGVSRSDIEVWRESISPTHASGRFVVLNKIDGLWDPLRSPEETEAELTTQVDLVARHLVLPSHRIFPVSAQKGLVAKVTQDAALLRRSRLPEFETALSREIVPQRQTLVREQVRLEFEELRTLSESMLAARSRALSEQLTELTALRGKNRTAIEHTARRIRLERADFDRSLRQLTALRTVFARHQAAIHQIVRVGRLKLHVREARQRMRDSRLSLGLQDGMSSLLTAARRDFILLSAQVEEVQQLMGAMYASFNREHGLTLGAPATVSTQRFVNELERIESFYREHFGPRSLMTTEKWVLTRRFFESIAVRIRAVYQMSDRTLGAWLLSLMAPIEGQIRERQGQLRRRLESVQRILDASSQLQARIAQLETDQSHIAEQLAVLNTLQQTLRTALDGQAPASRERAAAA